MVYPLTSSCLVSLKSLNYIGLIVEMRSYKFWGISLLLLSELSSDVKSSSLSSAIYLFCSSTSITSLLDCVSDEFNESFYLSFDIDFEFDYLDDCEIRLEFCDRTYAFFLIISLCLSCADSSDCLEALWN